MYFGNFVAAQVIGYSAFSSTFAETLRATFLLINGSGVLMMSRPEQFLDRAKESTLRAE